MNTVEESKTATYIVEVSANTVKQNIPLDKEWRIKFNQVVDANTLQNNIVPMSWKHVNFYGEYNFRETPSGIDLSEIVAE